MIFRIMISHFKGDIDLKWGLKPLHYHDCRICIQVILVSTCDDDKFSHTTARCLLQNQFVDYCRMSVTEDLTSSPTAEFVFPTPVINIDVSDIMSLTSSLQHHWILALIWCLHSLKCCSHNIYAIFVINIDVTLILSNFWLNKWHSKGLLYIVISLFRFYDKKSFNGRLLANILLSL